MKLLHISDLHLHRDPQDNQEADTLLRTIKQQYPEHLLIVTGDITDDGEPQQYDNARAALEPFVDRVFIAPGNHDFGVMGNFYSLERAQRFDDLLCGPLHQGGTFQGDGTPVVNTIEDGEDRVLLIALDTNLETDDPFDFACGHVGANQLVTLQKILCDPTNASWIKVLFFHHHPFIFNNPLVELKNARDLMRMIYARVDVVLFGHKHVSGQWENINGIRYILASDNSPGRDRVHEISVEGSQVTVNDVSLKPEDRKATKKGRSGSPK